MDETIKNTLLIQIRFQISFVTIKNFKQGFTNRKKNLSKSNIRTLPKMSNKKTVEKKQLKIYNFLV